MVYFLYQLAHQVLNNVFVLYTANRYAWTPSKCWNRVGHSWYFEHCGAGRFGAASVESVGEHALLFTGLMCGILGYAMYGLADESWKFWAATPIFSLMAFFGPAIQGLMSRRLDRRCKVNCRELTGA